MMTDIEKLRVLLPHWIAHNEDHCSELLRWATACEKSGDSEVARALHEAVAAAEQVTTDLRTALERAGGPLEAHESGSHHHGHEDTDH